MVDGVWQESVNTVLTNLGVSYACEDVQVRFHAAYNTRPDEFNSGTESPLTEEFLLSLNGLKYRNYRFNVEDSHLIGQELRKYI